MFQEVLMEVGQQRAAADVQAADDGVLAEAMLDHELAGGDASRPQGLLNHMVKGERQREGQSRAITRVWKSCVSGGLVAVCSDIRVRDCSAKCEN